MGTVCQDGYPRGVCEYFSASDENMSDSIEITAAHETMDTITIRYSLEKNYLPFSVGEHLFSWTHRHWSPPISDPIVAAHMNAYLLRMENLKLEFERAITN